MRPRMERFVLLPFTAGCISESSIAVGLQQDKRSKMDNASTPTRTHQAEKEEEEEEEEEYEDDDESLSAENLKTPLSQLTLPRFQKLFKNFKQSFVYKDELQETDIGMEIGLPTDVKHVTHIGLDGCASSILTEGWNNHTEPEMTNHPSLPLTPLELTMRKNADKHSIRSLLEIK